MQGFRGSQQVTSELKCESGCQFRKPYTPTPNPKRLDENKVAFSIRLDPCPSLPLNRVHRQTLWVVHLEPQGLGFRVCMTQIWRGGRDSPQSKPSSPPR